MLNCSLSYPSVLSCKRFLKYARVDMFVDLRFGVCHCMFVYSCPKTSVCFINAGLAHPKHENLYTTELCNSLGVFSLHETKQPIVVLKKIILDTVR